MNVNGHSSRKNFRVTLVPNLLLKSLTYYNKVSLLMAHAAISLLCHYSSIPNQGEVFSRSNFIYPPYSAVFREALNPTTTAS